MGKAKKILKRWFEDGNVYVEEDAKDVKKVLDEFFPGSWRMDKSSHIVAQHDALKHKLLRDLYGANGEIMIAVKGGKKVKKVYVNKLIKAINLIKRRASENGH